jgi:hypothetical protein
MTGKAIARPGYVLIVHDHVSRAENIFQRIKDAAALFEVGCPARVMVDARYYIALLDGADRAEIAARVRQSFPSDIRIAVVLRERSTAESVMPIIVMLRDAGLSIATFDNPRDAEFWLKEPIEVS